MGLRPSTDAKADQLRNSNMPIKDTEVDGAAQNGSPEAEPEAEPEAPPGPPDTAEQDKIVEDLFASLEGDIDDILSGDGES
jgi:hypothetical protein